MTSFDLVARPRAIASNTWVVVLDGEDARDLGKSPVETNHEPNLHAAHLMHCKQKIAASK